MKPNSVLHRYLPFLGIAILQLLLVMFQPSAVVAPGSFTARGGASGAAGYAPDVAAGQESASGLGQSTQGLPAGATAASAPAGGRAAAGAAAGGAGAGPQAAAQQFDAFGRPLSGDKSRCAPGGLIQQMVTRRQVPCMPKFVGDNGGSTSQGVTRDEILGIVWFHKPNQEVDTLLATQGFAISPEQNDEIDKLFEKFFNARFELYGRKIKLVQHVSQCESADVDCPRIEAKAIVAKHHPFAVVADVGAQIPRMASEELGRAGVVVAGAQYGMSRPWFKRMAPFAYSYQVGGTEAAEALGDYYCKKMWGKNATLAGDPALQLKKRKLGIISSEDPDLLASAQRLKEVMSGEKCGSPADGTTIYTLSTDSAQAQEQAKVLPTRMKNDGITTVTGASYGCTSACDQQNFFPENLMGAAGPWDVDPVARLVLNLNSSAAQARNLFGIGFYPWDPPTQEHDFARALRSVAPNYGDFPYIVEAIWDTFGILVHMMQFTGPNLTAANMWRAAQSMPQIGGYANPEPWSGWKCCDPERVMVKYGPEDFTAVSDAREVYWDPQAVSKNDGKPGAMVCPDGQCRRYPTGTWPSGEPKKAGS
jgi:hypothetical protein